MQEEVSFSSRTIAILPNNIAKLQSYCATLGWFEHEYTVIEVGQSGVFFAAVKVSGGGDNFFAVSTIPFDPHYQLIVKGLAALKALEELPH